MRCPYCGTENTQVKDSRPTEDGAAIRRRRNCTVCGGRFTTFERVQLRDLVVVKRSGRREPFDREKLARSVAIATRKRPVDEELAERMISGIVRQLESAGESDVTASRIGELAMEALKAIDDVAYVRFASVYRSFSEARDFEAFVADLARSVGHAPTDSHPAPDFDAGDPPARRGARAATDTDPDAGDAPAGPGAPN